MRPKTFGSFIDGIVEYNKFIQELKSGTTPLTLQSVSESIPFFLANLSIDIQRPMLILTPKQDQAQQIYEQMQYWGAVNAVLFNETEALPFERVSPDLEIGYQRLSALDELKSNVENQLIVSSAAAVMQKTSLPEDFWDSTITLQRGDSHEFRSLLDLWISCGYTPETLVEHPGQLSYRGGIIDIFPPNSQVPIRIELIGDSIDTIRTFSPISQRSIEQIDSCNIRPATEFLNINQLKEILENIISNPNLPESEKDQIKKDLELVNNNQNEQLIEILNLYGGYLNRGSIFDYLNQTFLLIICNPVDFNNTVNKFNERINDIRNKKVARRQLPDGFRSSHISPEELKNKLMRFGKTIDIVPWGTSKNDINTHFQMPFTTSESFYGKLDVAARRISELSKSGSIVAVVTNQSTRIKEVFKQYNIKLCSRSKSMSKLKPGEVIVMKASETCDIHGFSIKSQDNSIILLSDAEIFGAAKIRRAKLRRSKRIRKSLMKDLKLGDYLVHVDHGIAKFTGTHKDPKNQNEYLILQYALDDKLYVPMESLERVNPYIAPLGRTPHLSRLGSQTWNNTKAKASEATKELAGELLNIYATRNSATGYQFSTDSVWQNQLEDSFPHKETDDQIEALSAIKADMESKKPMDRLICGDVGYGKTEIAIRAAFKTVMEGKQVALLAPTTVLVQQHYVTFSERLSAYPINIEYLSRFRSPKEQKQVINDLVKGKVDICIGTHMLIQPNIEFTDLGLLIIDEEQRFGVSQKEQMKKIRSEVDVITLTATPIPRTLQMSMAGIKDISMVMTPPEERIPIKTYVTEQSDELIRDAIIRELDRGGQVYFVHNRVKDIHSIAKRISNIVPEAKIAVGHGQLNEAELEKTMLDFADGHIDVLICTTIIESGLDIQNANTMIINRAHTFGLAQLYQLRGRIGRGPKRSYAYFLVPDNVVINEVASRRLKTMLAATNLGAGFQIAMADLEIRGAGNILGGQQSGHINAIGYDLYSKMLSEATEQLRVDKINPATKTIDQNLTSINLDIPANIPSSYISDLHLRMDIYKQIIQAKDEQSLKEAEAMLVDRFGILPIQLENLLSISKLKVISSRIGIRSIFIRDNTIVIRMKHELKDMKIALKKRLSHHVQIGNQEIRQQISGKNSNILKDLCDLVNIIDKFQGDINKHIEQIAHST
ncbi:MAG: transcription-repair coupling factor [SAR202 cluster bacterium]|nr:transcription-repair coupling factor [SAR202 cluster bacterium]|tara:strand:- start:45482 stop:48997 length:3516 start_codon:yes stop_codon:yes gene_type:complete